MTKPQVPTNRVSASSLGLWTFFSHYSFVIRHSPLIAVTAALLLVAAFWKAFAPHEALVVYCAHDAIFAEDILRAFERQSGVRVAVKYDTEATKSLGLVELLLRAKNAPRCDVFWNNDLLGTLDLDRQGLLA